MSCRTLPSNSELLLEGARAGDRRMLARAISRLEAADAAMQSAISRQRPRRWDTPGRPHVVGISGPPGAGKSSMVDLLVQLARGRGQRVAVMAVDPSSPFSGGAILGDRVRMARHAGDRGVFVRSFSSRGHLGGLSMATGQVVDLLDLCGWDFVLVETVGVGQSEIAIMEVADTVIVVLTPESGDTVQTMKAGLLEIADLFVINKCDRPGAAVLAKELELAVEIDARPGWRAAVTLTSALRGEGLQAVLEQVEAHRQWIMDAGLAVWQGRRVRGRTHLCLDLVAEWARRRAALQLREGPLAPLGAALAAGETDPFQVFRALVSEDDLC